ncbi:uncharacterized protein cubi_01702 [Cryptosporidium ubiquitum]|uniref:Uncharacterized protein n=1 Tax=Cryptosporidium ubiquitum TaxID=857276 RepID=A0A1J4MCL2_9CRYT|nr:uncharacterized protein cubi_01702 [Cryptosporidium ubiquitum]OII71227.1 hypothetical protein cubi_01702 [Cryptosporidium ubiquitum]
MPQNILENEAEKAGRTLSSGSFSQEGNEPSSLYTVPLLLLIGFALKNDSKNKTLGPEIALDEQHKEEILSLILESRPAVVESSDSTKSFGGRFGAAGFSSRGNRGSQRGRVFSGQVGGGGRRSIIRQPNENLWDMPCSEMSSMTLGDIREAENKMKAEDLTLDQYVERQKESSDRKSASFSQSNQKKSFVSIPISGEAIINVSSTFSLNNNPVKNHQGHTTSNANDNFQRNSIQFNQQHNQHQQPNKDNFMSRFGQNGTLNSQNILNVQQNSISHEFNTSVDLRNELVGGERTNSSLFSTIANNRKSSSISEAFLSGPANLSLFDVNTPIFDDDNNETGIDFRPPIVHNNANTIGSFDDNNKNKDTSEELMRGQAHFEQGIQSSASNFSWSNRNSNSEEIDNKNISNLSDNSTSFPALSKNSQFSQSQVKTQNSHSSISSEPNILQKLHAAGMASKLVDKNMMDNVGHGNLKHNSFFETKFKHKSNGNEYPPLSSASNAAPTSLSSSISNNLKFNNQLKSNDAGRLLMSIIGAGQQNNNNRSYGSNFNVRNNNQRNNIHNTHNAHNSNYHNNGNHHNDQIGNFARY